MGKLGKATSGHCETYAWWGQKREMSMGIHRRASSVRLPPSYAFSQFTRLLRGNQAGRDHHPFTLITAIMADSLPHSGQLIQLAFAPTSAKDSGNFRLLELPPELLKSIESDNNSPLNWAIKGNPAEDAVLCTDDKTYSIRSVSLSNSVLVITPGVQDQVVIRDTSHELLQVAPILPRVHRLAGLLRGREYDEGREDLDDDMLDDEQDTQNQKLVCPPF